VWRLVDIDEPNISASTRVKCPNSSVVLIWGHDPARYCTILILAHSHTRPFSEHNALPLPILGTEARDLYARKGAAC